jgi:uncharacterized protein
MYRVLKDVKLQCSEIPEEGLRLHIRGRDSRWEGLEGFTVEAPPSGHLFVRRRGRDVLVQGEVHTTLRFECSRCLEDFPYEVQTSLSQWLRQRDQDRPQAKEIELAPDDLEFGTYDGEDILLDRVIEEHVLLSLPMRPLCSDGCKGLCPGCGGNRNRGECGCPEGSRGSSFDCLKDFVVKET